MLLVDQGDFIQDRVFLITLPTIDNIASDLQNVVLI